jgi:putative heme-binding domain-containing protein
MTRTAFLLSLLLISPTVRAAPQQPEIAWIWKSQNPGAEERVFFRREFQLPPDVASASLTVSCDNWNHVYLNGKDLGMAKEWNAPRTYEVLSSLKPGGANVIAIEGRNEGGSAALAVRFRAGLKGGQKLHVVSDASWTCSNEAAKGWEQAGFSTEKWGKAVVIAKMGDAPWGDVMPPEPAETGVSEDETAAYQVAPGFALERIYQVPASQGSWVSITPDDKGRFYCSDQYGKIYRVTPGRTKDERTTAEAMPIPLQGAHGLLWHQEVLWVSVNEGSDQSGVWRVTDTNNDGTPDKPELIKAVNGRGEHGPHSLVASPDGRAIYFVAGNHTDYPGLENSFVTKTWQEDQLLPRRPDANGHARDRMAPGGWIARFTPDGKNWQLFASGFRNDFDMAFNENGDLFAYDADMEWDFGMPWYRPTRICQVVPGAEFGWRNGTGKWPEYYEDSVPPVLDIGPGSPTGMISGKGAKFPAKYQRAVFALDWTFATLYAIHLAPEGAGYQATREEFVAGEGLPLTDVSIGKDGAMYFLTGGRRTGSALWRVTYTGKENCDPVEYKAKSFALMDVSAAPAALGGADRIARYEARTSLEQNDPGAFKKMLANPASAPWQVIGSAIGLARVGEKGDAKGILAALSRLDWDKLDRQQQLNWLRAAGLVFIRDGEPDAAARKLVLDKVDAKFPASDDMLNRELCRMLSYLEAPGIVARTLTLMDSAGPSLAPDWLNLVGRNASYGKTISAMVANLPPAQVIHYVYCLRVVKGPWQPDDRKRFFGWLAKLTGNVGGNSYRGFIDDLRNQTLASATPEERVWLEKLDMGAPPNPFANLPQIKGPGHHWTVDEVAALGADKELQGRDKAHGREMFRAALCSACHRIGGEGGSAGPDLSSVGTRFTLHDLAESIIDPNKTVSDQFSFDLITRRDGTQISGRIIEEKDGKWIVATNPFDLTQTTEVEANEIGKTGKSPVSPMPPALIDRLGPDELKDLLAYLLGK